jgi:NADPH2:quinone reductase
MRALVYDAAADDTSRTRVAAVALPAPGPTEVAIDVAFAGINFKDVMARRGDEGYVRAWPFVPGLEVAGTVRAVGRDVESVRVGQRVVALTNAGGLADVALAQANLTVAVPEDVELSDAAAAPGAMTTAVLLLDEIARLRPGDSLLVHSAAGAVGQAVADLARLRGVGDLVGTVGAPSRQEAAYRAGYGLVVVRDEHLAQTVRQHLSGRGVDVVLDPQGTAYLEQDLAILEPAGRIILFGNAAGDALDALPPTGRLFGANAAVGGFSLAALSAAAPQKVSAAIATVVNYLRSGELRIDPELVDGLENAAAAQQALAQGTGQGKYVVRLDSGEKSGAVRRSGALAR